MAVGFDTLPKARFQQALSERRKAFCEQGALAAVFAHLHKRVCIIAALSDVFSCNRAVFPSNRQVPICPAFSLEQNAVLS